MKIMSILEIELYIGGSFMKIKHWIIIIIYNLVLLVLFVFLSDRFYDKLIPIDFGVFAMLIIAQSHLFRKRMKQSVLIQDFIYPTMIMITIWLSNGFVFLYNENLILNGLLGFVFLFGILRTLTYAITNKIHKFKGKAFVFANVLTQYSIVLLVRIIFYINFLSVSVMIVLVEILAVVSTYIYVKLFYKYYC